MTDKSKDIQNDGETSDGYHTFDELYTYRALYNAAACLFWKEIGYKVIKSKLHSDGQPPFNDINYFIVQVELPTGQVSNHYEMKYWDLFEVQIEEKADPWDGHTPQQAADRIYKWLVNRPQIRSTYVDAQLVFGPILK